MICSYGWKLRGGRKDAGPSFALPNITKNIHAMAEETGSRSNILANLGKYLTREPDERLWPEIDRVIGLFLKSGETAEDTEAAQHENCELAVMLCALAEKAKEARFAALCIRRLAGLGPFGRILTVRYMEKAAAQRAGPEALLQGVADHSLLALTECFLASPARRNTDFREYCLRFIRRLAQGDCEPYKEYLADRAGMAPRPPFPIRQAIIECALGRECRDSLHNESTAAAVADAVELLHILREKELAECLLSLRVDTFPLWMLRVLLESVGRLRVRLEPQLLKKITSLTARPEDEVRLAALHALIRLRPSGLGKILNSIARRMPELQSHIQMRLPLVSGETMQSWLAKQPKEQRNETTANLYVHLCAMDPFRMQRALKSVQASNAYSQSNKTDREALLHAISAQWRSAHMVPDTQFAGQPQQQEPLEASPKRSFLGFRNSKKAKPQAAKTIQAKCEQYAETTFAASLINSSFAQCGFQNAAFTNILIGHSVFSGCRFSNVRFTQSSVTRTVFEDCVFDGCFFLDAAFRHCEFRKVSFHQCRIVRTEFLHVAFSVTHFGQGYFTESSLTDISLTCCRLQHALLQGATMQAAYCDGLVLEDCSLANVFLQGLELYNTRTQACFFTSCHCNGVMTDDPVLQTLESDSRESDCAEARPDPDTTAKLWGALTPAGKKTAMAAVDAWFAMVDAERAECLYERETRRRLHWAADKLGPAKFDFLRVLPFLLHSQCFEKHAGFAYKTPPCRIAGYTPDFSTLELARRFFADADLPQKDTTTAPIEAVYTIGSLGTTAQSPDSDIDYWICCTLENTPEHLVKGLQNKLEALRQWAENEFSLEVYFFLMDVNDVRANNFGFSDEESSGSAQALMLKEEFYRTMLKMAGKSPAWILVPAGASQHVYDAAVLTSLSPLGRNRFLDLGHVHRIPPEEYFGAALWQIVKALKSPFKSIIKFGLLERYSTASDQSQALICDRIKTAVLERDDALWRLDPYLALLQEVAEYYAKNRQTSVVHLLHFGFSLKSRIRDQVRSVESPARQEDRDLAMLFSQRVFPGHIPFRELPLAEDADIEGFMLLASRVNKFLVNTYVRVSDRLGNRSESRITDQDRTRLGRKIFAALAPRKHKIERLVAMEMNENLIKKMHFSADKHRARFTRWRVQGGRFNPLRQMFELKKLKSTEHAAQLFAWITANKLYHPDVEVKTDISVSPLTGRDIINLLGRLRDFFPQKLTFDTHISETLEPERVVSAFIILNLLAPREQAHIEEAAVVYSTNWGEMFCRVTPYTAKGLALEPFTFLKTSLGLDCSRLSRLDSFVPDRSRCPDIERPPLMELER